MESNLQYVFLITKPSYKNVYEILYKNLSKLIYLMNIKQKWHSSIHYWPVTTTLLLTYHIKLRDSPLFKKHNKNTLSKNNLFSEW